MLKLAIWGLILPVDFFHEQWDVLGVVADLQISVSRTATVSILKKLGLELNWIMLQLYLDLNKKQKNFLLYK